MAKDWSWAVTIKTIVFMSGPSFETPIIPIYSIVKYYHNSIGQAEYKGKTYALGTLDDSFQIMNTRKEALEIVRMAKLLE